MSINADILREVLAEQRERVQQKEETFQRIRNEIFQRLPRLREIDLQRRSNVAGLISEALKNGTDIQMAMRIAKEENQKLDCEERELLSSLNLPEDALKEKYICNYCRDTGYENGKICRCIQEQAVLKQKKQLSVMLDITEQSFDRFNLDLFDNQIGPDGESDRSRMEMVRNVCMDFCDHFKNHADNLFVSGPCGTGKTFISGCIAREISNQGFSVCYDTAAHIFSVFQAERFTNDETAADLAQKYLKCDLLILDDLGTEYTSASTISSLYTIVNQRMVEKKSTIINSNLTLEGLKGKYSPQIYSRIAGSYRYIYLTGKDLRLENNR